MKTTFILCILPFITSTLIPSNHNIMYKEIRSTIESLSAEFQLIDEERKEQLLLLSDYILQKDKEGKSSEIIFICTHNSRRSHMSQIWAQAAASYYGIENVTCYSGGTEATAFNPRAITAMKELGFHIEMVEEGKNPIYEVRYSDGAKPIIAFSKKYNSEQNPSKDFAAIMTCSHADKNCPLVAGADDRISIPYDDPKAFDGTPQESEKYKERALQIGREMLFVFSNIHEE